VSGEHVFLSAAGPSVARHKWNLNLNPVYIVCFRAARALQGFATYWSLPFVHHPFEHFNGIYVLVYILDRRRWQRYHPCPAVAACCPAGPAAVTAAGLQRMARATDRMCLLLVPRVHITAVIRPSASTRLENPSSQPDCRAIDRHWGTRRSDSSAAP
jgi:hypothetical protein